jgi:hypothetical protein
MHLEMGRYRTDPSQGQDLKGVGATTLVQRVELRDQYLSSLTFQVGIADIPRLESKSNLQSKYTRFHCLLDQNLQDARHGRTLQMLLKASEKNYPLLPITPRFILVEELEERILF